ncbi:winged helix-turn-helix transcriptional regulator [Plantactinospora sp. WMMB782]|uniref:winged helix-turn-helix transcriptional regulator n=1 Tax=Plantactinospora sp. WMMB782 TaxID=3404121 RepID=UPI003B92AF73
MPALPDRSCRLDAPLRAVSGRWKPAILWQLRSGPVGYAELHRRIDGVSERMLARQLQQLTADGVVRRTVTPSTPPRVDYDLTDRGAALLPLLDEFLARWQDSEPS